jgi:hypothetical protein
MTLLSEPIPLRLRVSRRDATAQLTNQVKIGRAIKGQRIRDRWELDQARAEKQEWVRRTTDTLDAVFNQNAIAEEFNDWAAPILPEYAEIDMFIDLFVDEMRHRLTKLQEVMKIAEQSPEPGPIVPDAAPSTTPAKETTMIAPAESIPTVVAATEPVRIRESTSDGLLLVRSGNPEIAQAISRFLSQLGLSLTVSSEQEKATTELKSSHKDFAVVLTADASACEGPSSGELLFEIGCCVGRLGHERVCVIHPNGQNAVDDHGVQHVPIDATDGWQLQLARHLRRGGVNVDLNKLL